jgi:hypothetical protein
MSKLEIKFELTGLKFEITGEKDNVSAALASLQQQVAAIAQSAASTTAALDGRIPQPENRGRSLDGGMALIEGETRVAPASTAARTRRRSTTSTKTNVAAIEFAHNPERFGFPKQDWNTATKAMWLLYVIELQTGQRDVAASVLVATFKHYFKEFGNLLTHNITRDLGGAKKKGLVNSDPSKNPETWYLLSTGKAEMQSLIENQATVEAVTAE